MCARAADQAVQQNHARPLHGRIRRRSRISVSRARQCSSVPQAIAPVVGIEQSEVARDDVALDVPAVKKSSSAHKCRPPSVGSRQFGREMAGGGMGRFAVSGDESCPPGGLEVFMPAPLFDQFDQFADRFFVVFVRHQGRLGRVDDDAVFDPQRHDQVLVVGPHDGVLRSIRRRAALESRCRAHRRR